MAEIGAWNGKKFLVTPALIRSFTGLSIRGSSKTEETEAGSETYVRRKSSKPLEITMTVELSGFTGCKVQSEAMAFVEDAREGACDYFYLGGKKLVVFKLMLTDASISDVKIAPNGVWTYCKINLTMKQASGVGGTTSGSTTSVSSSSASGGGGGGGGSTQSTQKKATSVVKTNIISGIQAAVSAIKVAQDYSAVKKQTNAGSRIMMLRD